MKTRRSRRNGVRKPIYRSLSIIARAQADAERFASNHLQGGTFGAGQGGLVSFWDQKVPGCPTPNHCTRYPRCNDGCERVDNQLPY